MPSIQVKNVPPDVHRELRRRASARRLSLQEYLLQMFLDETSSQPLDEVLARAGGRSGGSVPAFEVVEMIRADRDSR